MAADLRFLIDAGSAERAARLRELRELRALATLLLGCSHPATRALAAAVRDPTATEAALAAIGALPALPKRHLLATFGALALDGRAT